MKDGMSQMNKSEYCGQLANEINVKLKDFEASAQELTAKFEHDLIALSKRFENLKNQLGESERLREELYMEDRDTYMKLPDHPSIVNIDAPFANNGVYLEWSYHSGWTISVY